MRNWKAVCDEFLASDGVPVKTKSVLKKSLAVVTEAYNRYGSNSIAMSFNGGKDCLVMLIIILAVSPVPPPLTVYIRAPNSFTEVDNFVKYCAQEYKLTLTTCEQPMKEALQTFLNDNPEVKAVFVGIRRADPWAEDLQFFQDTDHGWPKFMRIHPVIEWQYDDIWIFLRHLHLKYCSLYDLGYTSLGSVTSTKRNPSLRNPDGSYSPAYQLRDPTQERIGRQKK